MASIRERKGADGATRFQVRWRNSRGRQETHTCPDRKTAKQIKSEIERARAFGQDWHPPRASNQTAAPRLFDIAQLYLEYCAAHLAPSTMTYRVSCLSIYLEHLADTNRGELHPDMLNTDSLLSFHRQQVERGLAVATANTRVNMVLGLWRWAEESPEWGHLFARPPRQFRLPHGGIIKRERGARPPTWAEADAFIHELETSARAKKGRYRAAVLMRFTGLRLGQVTRLQWSDFDLDDAMLLVRPQLGKSRQEKHGRRVPISPHLVEILAGWGLREGSVCLGVPQKGNQTILDAWKRTGVEERVWKGQSTHCLRHMFVTGLRGAGVSEDIVKILVGHSRGVTGDTYTHTEALLQELREAVAQVPPIGVKRGHCVDMRTARGGKGV